MKVRKLVTIAVLAAVGFVLTPFLRIPGWCAPMQHFINVTAAVLLGPWYGLACSALLTVMKLVLIGEDLLSIPGGCIGIVFAGVMYRKTGKIIGAVGGEIFGTGILGALCSYPISAFIYGNGDVALFTYIPAFVLSSTVGAFCAFAMLKVLQNSGNLQKLQQSMV